MHLVGEIRVSEQSWFIHLDESGFILTGKCLDIFFEKVIEAFLLPHEEMTALKNEFAKYEKASG